MATTNPTGDSKGNTEVNLDDSDVIELEPDHGAKGASTTGSTSTTTPVSPKTAAKPEKAEPKPKPTLPAAMQKDVLRIYLRGGRDTASLFDALKTLKDNGVQDAKAVEALTPLILKITEGKPELEAYALLCLTSATAMRVTLATSDQRVAAAVNASKSSIRSELMAAIDAVKALIPLTLRERLFGKRAPKSPKAAPAPKK